MNSNHLTLMLLSNIDNVSLTDDDYKELVSSLLEDTTEISTISEFLKKSIELPSEELRNAIRSVLPTVKLPNIGEFVNPDLRKRVVKYYSTAIQDREAAKTMTVEEKATYVLGMEPAIVVEEEETDSLNDDAL